MKKNCDPFDETSWPSEKEAMLSKIASGARTAASELGYADITDERLRSLFATCLVSVADEKRADIFTNYEYAKSYFAQFLEIGDAICAAMILHKTGPQQHLMIGTLAARLSRGA